ncbi:MAG: hypothetical protein J6S70_05015 [Clostridia bacterium]|nr:hypothetical protein [Clostridia bacterium]
MKTVLIADITLKKLAEERTLTLLFREKTAVADCADKLGADVVELPAVRNAREDAIIVKTISQRVENAAVSVCAGAYIQSVNAAWECVKTARRPVLRVELPVSTMQMEYAYHVKQEKMLEKIQTLVTAARSLCAEVDFVALDSTRADIDFLVEAVQAAEKCGASFITLCDDAGVSAPDDIGALTAKVKECVNVPVFVQPSDRINMGVASAFAAVSAGADGVKCALTGGDAVLTGELSDSFGACGAKIGACLALDNKIIHTGVDELLSGIGRSGSYAVSDTDPESRKILLDTSSTLEQVARAAQLLGYELSGPDAGSVYRALMQVCEKKGAVGSRELEAVIASSAMQAPSTYHFESYTTTSSNTASSMSQITLKCGGDIICGVSAGDGPIDSAFRAIEQCVGHHYELDDFQVQSVTEGKEALGSALVRLRSGGKLYSGNGTSTDIVAASIRAYINALNKIVFEENAV